MNRTDCRSFLKIAGWSLGIGVLYSAYPLRAAREKLAICSQLWGE